jgi:hypothetical protein
MWIKSAEISRALLATYEKIQDEIFHIMQIWTFLSNIQANRYSSV